MDTPDASGTESLASQAVVKIGDCLLCKVRERHTSDAGDDVAVNQIAVPALGVAIPFVPVAGEPLVAPPDFAGKGSEAFRPSRLPGQQYGDERVLSDACKGAL